jgi:hypothetical protein
LQVQYAGTKPAKTPIDTNVKLYPDEGRELEDATEYRGMIGSLIYLTLTRPDIAFRVEVFSRYMQSPRRPRLYAAQRVLRYLKCTTGFGVEFKREPNAKLKGYCEADHAGDPSNRRSTTRYIFMIGSSVVT